MDQCEDREEGVPPTETTLWGDPESQTKAQRPNSAGPGPESSCVSMKSDWLMMEDPNFRQNVDGRIQQQRPDSVQPTCVSFKSDCSKDRLIDFNRQPVSADLIVDQQSSEVPSDQSAQRHQINLDSVFMLLEDNIVTFVKNELKKIQKSLSPSYPECLESQREDEEVLNGEDEEQGRSSRESFLKITVNVLRRMKQKELADCLQSKSHAAVCQHKLKSNLKEKFQCVFEEITKAGNPTLLNQIYTELYITEGGTGELSAHMYEQNSPVD